jgi:magnesium transporter
MINRYSYKETVWVDIIDPTTDEIKKVEEEFNIAPSTIHELVSPSFKSRVDTHKDYIYLILHFPVFKHSHGDETKQEVDFIIGKNFLITARYASIDAMDKFAKIAEVNSILDRKGRQGTTGAIFFGIIEEIYRGLFHELEHIENKLLEAEEGIFDHREKEMVFALSEISRSLLNFKKSTDFHKEVLESLDFFGKKMFDENFSNQVHKILDEYSKVNRGVRNNMEFVSELRETNNSLLSTKENEIMKTLTIMAFVTFPLSLMAAVFSMGTKFTPIIGHPNDFWIILSFMIGATFMFFGFFKYKRWF